MNHQQLALCTLYHGKWWLPALFIDSWVSMHRKHLVSSALWRPLEHLTQSGKWHSDWTLGSILPPPMLCLRTAATWSRLWLLAVAQLKCAFRSWLHGIGKRLLWHFASEDERVGLQMDFTASLYSSSFYYITGIILVPLSSLCYTR